MIQIGRGPRVRDEDDLVDLLLECHGRIRSFLGLARHLAAAGGLPAPDVRQAAGRVRRYFTEALPLHVRDEEHSVLPRLAGREPELDAALARMNEEHQEHGRGLAALLELCATLEAAPQRHGELRRQLAVVAEDLEAELIAHLDHEERLILPAIRRLLDPAEQAAMIAELRARRAP